MAQADDGVTVTAHVAGATVTLVLRGEFDLRGVRRVADAVGAALGRHPATLAVDAAGLTFVDSAGLHALVRARQLAGRAGVAFVLDRSSVALDQLIDLAGLRDTFGASRSSP